MKTFGLIGKSLLHSFSQQYFEDKFLQEKMSNVEYKLFKLETIKELKELFKHPSLCGFNVTIPYKTEILPYLDGLDAVAQEIGAVNCVVKQNNKWMGYNTDVIGFEMILNEIEKRSPALVLGSGGASKAVCYVLKQKKIPCQIVSRNKTKETISYNELTSKIINHYKLIINTTPLGMFPQIDTKPPIPYTALNKEHILIDLIYNPDETIFLKEGKERDAYTINGALMFNKQAEASWELFKNSIVQ